MVWLAAKWRCPSDCVIHIADIVCAAAKTRPFGVRQRSPSDALQITLQAHYFWASTPYTSLRVMLSHPVSIERERERESPSNTPGRAGLVLAILRG